MLNRAAHCLVVVLLACGAACNRGSPEQTEPTSAAPTRAKSTARATEERGAASSTPGEDRGAPDTEPRPGGGSSAKGGNTVAPSELDYVEMKVIVDETTGNPKEDNWRYLKIWGELKNKSSQWVETIAGDIRYFDAEGKELAISSVSSASKLDVGDKSPGERIGSDVMYIAPGASAPMHHIRALAKLGGKYASHKITLRPATIVTKFPEGVLEGLQDQVATVANEQLTNATPQEHRVISGAIRNKGTLGCRKPGLVVGFYDVSGKLADLSEGDAKEDVKTVVAPGSTIPVKVFTLVGFDNAWKAKATIKTWVSCSEPYD